MDFNVVLTLRVEEKDCEVNVDYNRVIVKKTLTILAEYQCLVTRAKTSKKSERERATYSKYQSLS